MSPEQITELQNARDLATARLDVALRDVERLNKLATNQQTQLVSSATALSARAETIKAQDLIIRGLTLLLQKTAAHLAKDVEL